MILNFINKINADYPSHYLSFIQSQKIMNVLFYDEIVTWSLNISDKSWVSTMQVKWSNEVEIINLTVWLCIILNIAHL